MTDRLYTTDEAAAELGVPKSTISTWRYRGRVTPVDFVKGRGRGGWSPLYRLSHLRPLADAYHSRRGSRDKHE